MDLKGDKLDAKKSSSPSISETEQQQHSSNYAPYPKLDPTDVAPPPPSYQESWGTFVGTESQPQQSQANTSVTKSESPPSKSVSWSPELTDNPPPTSTPTPILENTARAMPPESNPYVSASSTGPSSASTVKNTVNTVKDVLGRWGKKVGETSKKAEELAGNVWQHLNTGPSVADAALGRIAQGTKVIAEGGYEKIFQRTFNTVEEEQLKKSFACYLSTSAGPVMGVLYLSTVKLAFCSDNPLSYKNGDQTEWSYYKDLTDSWVIGRLICWDDLQETMLTIKQHIPKSNLLESVVQVVLPLHQLKAVNPSVSKGKPVEKYIQVISVDNHEFWFMAFVNYDSAIKCLQEALQVRNS